MTVKKTHNFLTLRYSIVAIILAVLATILFLIYNTVNSRQRELLEQEIVLAKLNSQIIDLKNDLITLNRSSSDMLAESGLLRSFGTSLKQLETGIEALDSTHINGPAKLSENSKNVTKYFHYLLDNLQNDVIKSEYSTELDIALNKMHRSLQENTDLIQAEMKSILFRFNRYNLIIWLGSLIAVHLVVILIFRPAVKRISGQTNQLIEARNEAALATQTKSDYLSAMSHEIRTPLNSILGLNQLLLQTKVSPEQKEYLELIEDSGDNLLQILNDIFDFSKIDYGQLELDEMAFSIHSIIEDLVEYYLPKAAEKNLDLLYIIEPDVPEFVLGDSLRLKQCVYNLINNSIKFTRDGEIIIRVNVLNVIDNKQEIQISVSDTGIGIPENKLKTLFNPFVHSPSPVSRRFEGTGLGLAIAARLIELMKGRIWVESEINKGTTFYLAIYFEVQKDVTQITSKKDLGLVTGKRVLIMDNDETNRKITTVQCHNWGMYPKSISSVHDVLNEIQNGGHFDFAILNYDLIKAFSPELIEKIKSVSDLPLLLTSTEDQPDKLSGHENVMFLKIPFKQAVLYEYINKIATYLSEKGQHKEDWQELTPADVPADLKLLLAEDNLINQKLIERIMSNIGYSIDIAHDGYQAVELAAKQSYDIIFMDLQMPGLDGIEATRKILNSNQKGEAPRIIAMTANVRKEDKELCFEAGMVDYITKPISVDKVKQLLTYWGTVSQSFKSERS